MDKHHFLSQLKQKLIASCQPVDDGPMDSPEIVAAMAQACIIGNAAGVRIEGADNVEAAAKAISAPIVGIIKRDLDDSDVRITPFLDDVKALAESGAQIIAYDATLRNRPETTENLVKAIHNAGCIAMADCSTFEEGKIAAGMGVELIATTLSGYTGGPIPAEPDFALLRDFAAEGYKVVAEGRFNTPELAAKAIEAGAHCVTVGSALTRLEHVSQWFSDAIHQAASQTKS